MEGCAGGARGGAAPALERTLALVKPDSVATGKADEILHLAELAGFTILQKRPTQLTPAQAEEFYAEHRGRPFFAGLVEFMTSGPLVAAALAAPDAIAAWRRLIGPTNADEARAKAPKSIRALYGTNGTRNAVHGSDSAASAEREAAFFFPALPPLGGAPALRGDAAEAYITSALQPALVKGLTALAKTKPSSKPEEAVEWLAQWLLANNPNRPRVITSDAAKAEATAAALAAANAVAVRQAAAEAVAAAPARGMPSRGTGMAAPGALQRLDAEAAADLGTAATKVQAAFRGHHARQQVADLKAGDTA